MLSDDEKGFFIGTATAAGKLSRLLNKSGAVLIRDRELLAYGFEKIITEPWTISAVYDTLFGSRSKDLQNTTLFCNHFPSLNDLLLIISVGVTRLYFTGEIKDAESVKFLNKINESGIPLEIIELETK